MRYGFSTASDSAPLAERWSGDIPAHAQARAATPMSRKRVRSAVLRAPATEFRTPPDRAGLSLW